MTTPRPSIIVGLTISSALISSCQFLTPKQSLDPQREQVRTMRSELEGDWSKIKLELDDADRSVDQFAKFQVDPAKFDPKALSAAILDQLNTEVAEGTASKARAEASLASFKAAAENTDSETRASVEAVYSEGERIQQMLTADLPKMLEGFLGKAADVPVQLAEVKASAEALSPVAESNPAMSGDDMQKFRADQAALEADIADLTGFADKITRDSATYSQRVAATTARFQAQVEALAR